MRLLVCALVLASVVLVQADINSFVRMHASAAAPYVTAKAVRNAHYNAAIGMSDDSRTVMRSLALSIVKYRVMDAAEGLSQACAESLQGLGRAFGVNETEGDNELARGGCGDRASDVWDFARNDTIPTQADVAGWCDGCAAGMRAALRGVRTACTTDADLALVNMFIGLLENLLAVTIDLPCLKSPSTGQYCLPEFYKNKQTLDNAKGNLTASSLEAICSDCTVAYFRLLKEFAKKFEGAGISAGGDDPVGPPSAGGLSIRSKASLQEDGPEINPDEARDIPFDLLCFKLDGEYCYPQFVELQQNPSTNETEQLDRVCQPCIRQFITSRARELEAGDDDGPRVRQFARALPLICAANADGVRCGQFTQQKIANSEFTYLDAVKARCDNAYQNNLVCPANCTQALTAFNTAAGCCARAVFGFIQLDNSDFNATKAIAWSSINCTVTLTELCAPLQTAKVILKLSNIKRSFFDANKTQILAAVAKDVAKTVGVPLESVTVTEVTGSALSGKMTGNFRVFAGEIQLQAQISTYTAAEATTIANQLTTAQSSGLLATDNLAASVPDSAKEDPNRPLTGGGAFSFSSGHVASVSVATLVLAATAAFAAAL